MNVTLLKGYPDFIGKRQAWAGYGNGPSSYVAGGDAIVLPQYNGYIDAVFGPVYSVSGNYLVTPIPSGAGPRQTWKLKWSPAQVGGIPLTLGALQSATRTTWNGTTGLGTVTAVNTLVAGQFVLLTGFTSNYLIFMNGTIVQVVSAASSSFTFYWGPAAANGTVPITTYGIHDDAGDFQVLQTAAGTPVTLGTASAQIATITGVAVASGVLTVTAANTFSPGQFAVIQGLASGEVPQGVWGQILTATTSTFTMSTQCKNLSTTAPSDTGTATLLVTANNLPISTGPMQAINGTTVAATIISATAAGALTALPVNQNWSAGNLFIIQGLTHGAALNGKVFAVASSSLSNVNVTAAGFVQVAVTTGTADFGTGALLTTGSPGTAYGEMTAGTNLSAEQVQIGGFGGQY